MKKISDKELLRRVVDLGERYPNAMYTNPDHMCSYTEGKVIDGPPNGNGCIIGQSLDRTHLEYLEKKMLLVDSVSMIPFIKITDFSIMHRLMDIQGKQDNGYTWGESVRNINTEN